MRLHSRILPGPNQLGLLIVLGTLLLLWQTLRAAATFSPDPGVPARRAQTAIREAAHAILRPGDTVFVSSDEAFFQDLSQPGVHAYKLDPLTVSQAESPLVRLLDESCRADSPPLAYWIWQTEHEVPPVALGAAARALNFFYTFQAVLPYQGDAAFAIDKFLRLQPKDIMLRRYCEASRLAGSRSLLLILDADRYSPWIGSFAAGRITWLAGSPQRNLNESLFAVQDMPPLLTYDVYWLVQVPLVPRWIFENQDFAAYEAAVRRTKAQSVVVLADRNARLDGAATRFLRKCTAEETALESALFQQMCFR